MDETLFDDILCEIFTRLPSSSSSIKSVPLVSKRWLRLYRASKTSMSLHFNRHENSVITLLPSIFHNHPCLSSLSLVFTVKNPYYNPLLSGDEVMKAESIFNDELISIISSCCFNLRKLSFLINPISLSSLLRLSTSLSLLTSLSIKLYKPQNSDFSWIALFRSLKELSIDVWSIKTSTFESGSNPNPEVVELGLESVSLSGIQSDETGVSWLWRSCRKLKKLSLKSCGTIGEIEFFGLCLKNLEEIELRTCRSIVDLVLLKVSEICESLKSLLIHDGGNKDGLVHFMNNARCNDTLKRLDLRLPMDLTDDHLLALASNFKSLSSLTLTSCIFVTGLSLKALSLSFSSSLEELSLLKCDAVEREPGLLATLGQHLGRLRKLELPYNEWLFDKEVVSMLASCNGLVELNLRGCKNLSGSVLVAVNKNCVKLKTLDIVSCRLIQADEVEDFVMKSSHWLKKLVLEENQITEAMMKLASSKLIETVVFESLV
ncbi:F-box/LRR-repeat protein 4 [Cardamine amara subsp. amara]|uniref:F-box/LRR-repeat protein 4 n=1 Tax=Cardamine amara subsp. amara TaxID=228776 RepID=A0ABD1BB77_CARAN